MDYFLTDDQKEIRSIARQIAEERIVPFRAYHDETEEFPWDIIKVMADSDMFRVFIPEEYDGLGSSCLDLVLVIEEFSRACAGIALCYAATSLGTFPILIAGSDEQKQKYLPDIASGKRLAAFAITESSAGSDAGSMKTTAEKVDGGYLLNGTKQFISNGGEAEIYSIIALTDKSKGPRGASAFVLEKGMEGFSFGKKEKKLGIRANATRELVFKNCFVPDENRLGKEGTGFITTLKVFDSSRPGIAAQALGIAQGALEAATDYARQRIQFGHPIIALPAVQAKLADMAMQTEAARALTYACARTIDAGNAKNFSEESAMVKVFASDTAMKVTVDAIQVHGGVGYMRDYPVEKMMRDAKITQIYEGANEVLRETIAMGVRKRKGRND